MALEVYLYWEPSLGSSACGTYDAALDDQDYGSTGTTHDVVETTAR
jgi:hypothetical protein